MTISKKLILNIVVLVWLIFSVVYICYDAWKDFQTGKLAQAYQAGRVDTINSLITEAEKCQPFSVFSAEKQVQLIKVNCQSE